MMRIQCRVAAGVVILDLQGKIRIGEETEALRTQVNALASTGVKRILLNLEEVTEIDSSGIGELVGAYTTVSNRGGALKLLNLTKRVRELMTLTKLLTIFEAYEDEQEAIESFD